MTLSLLRFVLVFAFSGTALTTLTGIALIGTILLAAPTRLIAVLTVPFATLLRTTMLTLLLLLAGLPAALVLLLLSLVVLLIVLTLLLTALLTVLLLLVLLRLIWIMLIVTHD